MTFMLLKVYLDYNYCCRNTTFCMEITNYLVTK